MPVLPIVIGLLPGFVWLVFYLREDEHPEPKRWILITFIVGCISAFFTLVTELVANSLLTSIGILLLTPGSILTLAFIEEWFKFSAAYIAMRWNPEFNEPVDAMIYMIVAALGFATIENIAAVLGPTAHTPFYANVFQTVVLRFVGATLLHTLAAGIIGYYWAKSLMRRHDERPLIFGLLFATVLHGVFNYLILNYANIAYSVGFLVLLGLLVLIDFEKLKRPYRT